LVCVGALANLKYALDHDLQANALATGGRLMQHLVPLTEKFGVVGEVRGKGLMIGIELVGVDGRTPSPAAASRAIEHARTAGLLIGKGGLYGNCLRLAPPLSLTMDEADEGGSILVDVLATVNQEEDTP
jgi:4-aminobutyrate aminotransferase